MMRSRTFGISLGILEGIIMGIAMTIQHDDIMGVVAILMLVTFFASLISEMDW